MAARDRYRHAGCKLSVSILVLVDWRWRPPRGVRAPYRSIRFNPCSGGLEMAATVARGGNPPGTGRFQSLFWWIGDGGSVPVGTTLARIEVSILVLVDWRWRRLRARRRGWARTPVSILVLVDWRWRRHKPQDKDWVRLLFQSLFWWIGDGGRPPSCGFCCGCSGFNPCSGGLEMAAGREGVR